MKFEAVLGRCRRHELSQVEAAEILGITERTFRRWHRRHEEEGLDGLLDRYVESQVYQAVVENNACEQAARMIAMKNATGRKLSASTAASSSTSSDEDAQDAAA